MVMMGSQTFFLYFQKKLVKYLLVSDFYISLQRSSCRNTGGADIGTLAIGCPSAIDEIRIWFKMFRRIGF